MRRPTALALALATSAALAAPAARGAPARSTAAATVDPASVPRATALRLALSPAAASFLTEPRMRALLEVELQGLLPLGELATGPLDEAVVRAWIDQPDASTVAIQVQAPGRGLTHRLLDVTGLTWDVAAHFTALGTAELVRAQLAPVRTRRPRPRIPTRAEIDAADRARPRWVVAAGAHARAGEGLVAGGPELEVGHATPAVDVRLGGRVLGGDGDARLRAVEIDLAAQHRIHPAPWLRVELGGAIGVGTAGATVGAVDHATGYGRLAARAGLAARVAPQTSLGLRVEPGVIVGGPEVGRTGPGAIEGASLGLSIALTRDLPLGDLVIAPAGR